MAPFSIVSDVQPGPINPSVPDSSNVVFFSSYERKGVIIMAVAGVISCAFVSILLLYIIFSAISLARSQQKPGSPSPFIRKQVAVFVICLLVSDLIQSISGILQTKWAIDNRIYESSACTAQAATLVMGDLGSTIWSCVIAAHTFSGLALGKQWSRLSVYIVVIVGWASVIILTIIGPTVLESAGSGPFFGIAGEWCFITSNYAIPRLVIHYVPLFVAALIIIVLYGLVFLVLRGSISFTPNHGQPSSMRLDDVFMRERVIIAKRMLWYPVAYLTCIFPIATIRLVGLNQEKISDGVWIFGMFFLFLLGAVDSVIYTTTRNLIKKPFRFSMPSHTSSSDVSSGRTDGSPRKSGFSDIGRAEIHRALDMTQYSRWDKIRASQNPSGPHDVQSGVTAVHVTFERIQEVM